MAWCFYIVVSLLIQLRRKDLSFEERQQNIKVTQCKDVRGNIPKPVLNHAYNCASGKTDVSKIVNEIMSSPKRPTRSTLDFSWQAYKDL